MSLFGDEKGRVNSSFTYLDAGGEQTMFEITASTYSFVSQIILDLNALTLDGTIKIYSKIDGTNYREVENFAFTKLTDTPGYLIDLRMPLFCDFKITYTEVADEGDDRIIPYRYFLEI